MLMQFHVKCISVQFNNVVSICAIYMQLKDIFSLHISSAKIHVWLKHLIS